MLGEIGVALEMLRAKDPAISEQIKINDEQLLLALAVRHIASTKADGCCGSCPESALPARRIGAVDGYLQPCSFCFSGPWTHSDLCNHSSRARPLLHSRLQGCGIAFLPPFLVFWESVPLPSPARSAGVLSADCYQGRFRVTFFFLLGKGNPITGVCLVHRFICSFNCRLLGA